jgi:hypothetical protein
MSTFEMKKHFNEQMADTGAQAHRVMLRYVRDHANKEMQVVIVEGTHADGTPFSDETPIHHPAKDKFQIMTDHAEWMKGKMRARPKALPAPDGGSDVRDEAGAGPQAGG